jgi:hypothetical protein
VKIARITLRAEKLARAPTSGGSSPASASLIAKAILQNFFQLIRIFQPLLFKKSILTKRRTQRRKDDAFGVVTRAALSQQCNSGLSILGSSVRCSPRAWCRWLRRWWPVLK